VPGTRERDTEPVASEKALRTGSDSFVVALAFSRIAAVAPRNRLAYRFAWKGALSIGSAVGQFLEGKTVKEGEAKPVPFRPPIGNQICRPLASVLDQSDLHGLPLEDNEPIAERSLVYLVAGTGEPAGL
jgi:hypothetical protein